MIVVIIKLTFLWYKKGLEAVALYNFEARQDDELSFHQGEILTVNPCPGGYPHWYQVEKEGVEGIVPRNYVQVKPQDSFSCTCKKLEAVALYNFEAGQADELSFLKGDILKVNPCPGWYPRWYQAEKKGVEGLVPNNYVHMKPHDWFSCTCTKDMEAEKMLLQDKFNDGTFIVRPSEAISGDATISVKVGMRKWKK